MSWEGKLWSFLDQDPGGPPPKKRIKSIQTSENEDRKSKADPSSCNWLLQYKPKTVDDLAVHVKKVQEITSWLEQSTNPKSTNKLLLLTGPSGCAKTTALQIISKSMGFRVSEWITPVNKPSDEFPSHLEFSKSTTQDFQEYLLRSSRYNSLTSSSAHKLVLVKDFPNSFLHNPSTFHDILENYWHKCVNPVVFISSDEGISRKLFPASLKQNCHVHAINVNPVTDQRMIKILKSIISTESKLKNVKMLTDESISTVSAVCQGDLKSAILKLYFCSITSDFDITQLKTQRKSKKTKSSDKEVETDKDIKLDFFRGIGRVLYPKKVDSDKGIKFVHSTNAVVENFLTEPNNFLNQLHENYFSRFGDIYDISAAADRLSNADLLMARWQDKDIFHTYALSVAVQGLMVCNKSNQKGRYEAFRGSQTSRLQMDSKALQLEGKAVFSELCTENMILNHEHLIDILPYSKLLLPNLNIAQLEFVRRTCTF